MPYQIKGNAVIKKDSRKVVGHSSKPEEYIRVLRAVEHGWRPTGKRKISSSDGYMKKKGRL